MTPIIPEATDAGVSLRPDHAQVDRFLSLLVPGVYEIRIPSLEARKPRFFSTQHMYLKLPDDLDTGVSQVVSITGRDAGAVYIVGNPVDPALLGRGRGAFYRAKSTAADADVVRRRLFYVDVDSVRPSAINASADEITAAMEVTHGAHAWLADRMGFPEPLFLGTSGSGGMILYRLDMENSDESTAQAHSALEALADECDTDRVHVDTGVHNAARIFRVPGTVNAKSNTPQPDRPWRLVQGTFTDGEVIHG
jgi:hypothetical protein